MKKTIMAAVVAGAMLLSGCVSEESYNKLLSEKAIKDRLNSALETQNKSLITKNESLEAENSSLKAENSRLQAENNSLRENTSESVSTSESESKPTQQEPNGTEIYDDPFVNISFWGIQKYSGKECVAYIVENKNDFALHVWDPTVALDGLDLGEMTGMYDISPKSKGKVYFYKEDKSGIGNNNPSTISGSLIINSKGNEKINDQVYYKISFFGDV